jgi:LysM repeat protein
MPAYGDRYWGDSVTAVQTAAQQDAAERARFANAAAAAASAAANAPEVKETPVIVTVKPGDTLSAIAAANDLSLKELYALNPKFKTNDKYEGGSKIWSGTTVKVGTTTQEIPKTSGTTTPPPGGTTTPPPGGDTTPPPGDDTTPPPGDDTTPPPGDDTTPPPGDDTTPPPGGDTTPPPGGNNNFGPIGPGAGGAGPDAAATGAILDQIKALTDQIAAMQAAAAAEAAKPKVVGTRTIRKTGGVVEVVEIMSDGSQGKVIESYKDFGARDSVMKMFENTGLGQDFIKSLMDSIDKVYEENIMPTDAQVLNSIYSSDAYKKRFAANEAIRKRLEDGKGRPGDRLLSPAEYIKTEQAYQEILQESGMPAYFYDQPEDFTRLIENSISVAELTSRVNIAQNALQKADQGIVNSLKSYYGLSTGDLVAYLLDNEKAWDAINSRFQYSTEQAKLMYTSAEVGGAAERAGLGATKGFAEEITKAGKAEFAERAFQGAARDQRDYERLMGLYGETSTKEDLAREALALAGGAEIGIKSKKLASKERAKFQQRSAIDKTSLGSRLRTPDV